jgi:two-component system sensor histidine kinase QseC
LDKFNFQVWTNTNTLLLHSSGAPRIPLSSNADGFSDKLMDSQKWRVFTTSNSKAGIHTVIAERYDTRNELGQRIALDDLYIMLLTFPLSGLLIWIVIGKGLDSLDRVAQEVGEFMLPQRLSRLGVEGGEELAQLRPLAAVGHQEEAAVGEDGGAAAAQ